MSLPAGTRLGPYEILAPLGAGGMGEVYRARDTRLGRETALKVLPDETASDSSRRQRFEQEARSASALNHPNIITIYDIGSANSITYIAMELVEGRTLRELIAAEPLASRKLLELAVQIADGLAKAHSAGIVHRDLKPENVMVTRDGVVKILDFGLAKLAEPVSQEASALPTAIAGTGTEPGTVMGTAGYMSPEQASGHTVDFRSDQFSLGAILYEMATGRRAFQRPTGAETLVAIMREEPEPVAQANPKVPAPIRWTIERCLSKDPEDRYASTKDLSRDLRSIRDHLSETSVSGGLAPAEPARMRRRGWLLPAALALGAGAAIGIFLDRILVPEPEPPAYQRLTFRRGAVVTARFAPDGSTIVYGAAWEGNPVEVFSTRPESPESRPLGFVGADVLAASSGGELALSLGRHFVIGWESAGTLARVPLSGGAPREVLERVQDADWSPDGKELAIVRAAGKRRRLEYPIGKVLYEASGWLSHPRVSSNGRLVAFFEHPERGDNAGRVVVVDGAGKKRLTGPLLSAATGLAWLPNGQEIWASGGGVQSFSLTGKSRFIVRVPGGLIVQDVSRDGRLLAKRTAWRREIVGLAPGDTRERNLTWLDWSFPDDLTADGRVLLFDEQQEAAGARGGYLSYVRKTDGSPAVLLGQARGFGLSPDGKWALTITGPGQSRQLALLPTGAGSPRPLPKTGLLYQWVTFFPDGRRFLATAVEPGHAARLYIQDIDGGKPKAVSPEGFSVFARTISPDSKTIAAIGPDRKIHLFSTDGRAPRHLPGAVEDEIPLGWTSDGRAIYLGRPALPARVDTCDIATGERRLWKQLVPPDAAGVLAIAPVLIAADGKSYVYSYRRMLEDLYLVTGLK